MFRIFIKLISVNVNVLVKVVNFKHKKINLTIFVRNYYVYYDLVDHSYSLEWLLSVHPNVLLISTTSLAQPQHSVTPHPPWP